MCSKPHNRGQNKVGNSDYSPGEAFIVKSKKECPFAETLSAELGGY